MQAHQITAEDGCWANKCALVQAVQPMDPRIHFALVCGAKSCPPIKVYTADSLHEGLESATIAFCEGIGTHSHRSHLYMALLLQALVCSHMSY